MHFTRLAATLAMASTALAWLPNELHQGERLHARDLPAQGKTLLSRDGRNLFLEERDSQHPPLKTGIRGVNLGSLFVFEPWIASDVWASMCGSDSKSEFDCSKKLGQDKTDQVFQNHWKTWITQDDFNQMAKYGLNTVRIPVGYWMMESIVDRSSEPFPRGGLEALATTCDQAAQAGLYIIIDHHGAPGAQVENNPDTGQYNPNPGFFTSSNYQRGEQFLGWMTAQIHNDTRFRNVGMLEVLNEPEQNSAHDDSMRQQFYPAALSAIRNAESAVPAADQLSVFFMNQKWGAGDPTQYLPSTQGTAYDDHRYVKWASQQDQSKAGYKKTSCGDDRSQAGLTTVVGEWSLSVADAMAQSSDWTPSNNQAWYAGWFAAQAMSYAKTNGWIFWTWKTSGLNDPRWDYSMAVQQGIIPASLSGIEQKGQQWCASN